MKCLDLHKKVIFASPSPHEGVGEGRGSIKNKEFLLGIEGNFQTCREESFLPTLHLMRASIYKIFLLEME